MMVAAKYMHVPCYTVPGEIGDIETAVTFLSDGTPHLWMSFSV